MKNKRTVNMPEKDYKRLRRIEERQIQMKPLIRQLNQLIKQTKNYGRESGTTRR